MVGDECLFQRDLWPNMMLESALIDIVNIVRVLKHALYRNITDYQYLIG